MYRILLRASLAGGIAWLLISPAMTAEPAAPPNPINKPARLPDSVAMVIDLSGKPTVVTVTGAGPAHRMQLLRPGDQLRAENGQVKLIFLADKHFEIIKSSRVTIGKLGCEPPDSVQRVKAAEPQNSSALDALRKETGRSAAGFLRGRGVSSKSPPRVTPSKGTVVLTDRPSFAWPAHNMATGYEIVLTADGSRQEVWRRKIATTTLAYPSDAPPLKHGRRYLWRVRHTDRPDDSTTLTSEFSVATQSEAEELKRPAIWGASQQPDKILLAAMTFGIYGANDEALRMFERLTMLAPDDSAIWEHYADFCGLAGRADDARRARERAKSLETSAGQK